MVGAKKARPMTSTPHLMNTVEIITSQPITMTVSSTNTFCPLKSSAEDLRRVYFDLRKVREPGKRKSWSVRMRIFCSSLRPK
jgi:hypothetical protein